MNNYNVNKEMAGVTIVFITLFFILSILSPYFKESCNTMIEKIKKQKCKIKVEKTEHIGTFKIIGIDPETFQPCECYDGNRWWSFYKNELEPGDYFIKNEGQPYFEIIKKDTIIKHEYTCYSE
ncbi:MULTISPECIES: hypothetical protein [Chryseobacterium]|uniref:Uncharacterized protein n=1 Tax=Chryseobacterium rhizosphaerae TaxID=395937 RepID=A0ABX9IE21_9FLAO|nr:MULTISPECIES: hypothetical protein [Chryseobacterium]REC70356.1 hypothetical protein DRF57_22080 [Chryseobacterium rhizosphaerae]GEN69592.1 hypothetical protein CRH01_41600 [Chryseobacterium rhizosphaerae]